MAKFNSIEVHYVVVPVYTLMQGRIQDWSEGGGGPKVANVMWRGQ